jgi:hypothetical protein
MKTGILGIIFFGTFATELFASNPYIICSKSLIALKGQGHSVQAISKSATDASLEFLAVFRSQKLSESEFDYHPQSRPASANYSSSWRAKQAVARRISALLKEGRVGGVAGAPEFEAPTNVLYAGSLVDDFAAEGESDLSKYLTTLKAAEAALFAQRGSTTENFREHLVPFGIAPFMTFVLGFMWQDALLHNPRAIPFTFLLSIAPYPLVEQGIRGIYHYRPRLWHEEKWIESRRAAFQRNRWWYSSEDYLLDRDAFNRTWATGEMSVNCMMGNFCNLLAPRITKKRGSHPYIPKPTVVLQFDRLLASEPATGKPVYFIFVRAYDQRPKYPKVVRQRSARLVFSGQLQPEGGGVQ